MDISFSNMPSLVSQAHSLPAQGQATPKFRSVESRQVPRSAPVSRQDIGPLILGSWQKKISSSPGGRKVFLEAGSPG